MPKTELPKPSMSGGYYTLALEPLLEEIKQDKGIERIKIPRCEFKKKLKHTYADDTVFTLLEKEGNNLKIQKVEEVSESRINIYI